MILNTGARTDTVQYYSDWLLKRFEEGFVYTRNPLFTNKVTKYELSPDKIDLVMFCSKNYKPILPRLHEITDNYRTYFHYTITAYGKDVEPGVPSIDESIETLIALSKLVGKQKIAWRYDPILLTDKYTFDVHAKTFEYMAKKLAPYIDRCIFSFVEMYKKLQTNMPEIIPLGDVEKNQLAEILGSIAKKYGIYIQTCGTNGDYSQFGIHSSGCATLEILGKANNCEFKDLKHKGLRTGCHCILFFHYVRGLLSFCSWFSVILNETTWSEESPNQSTNSHWTHKTKRMLILSPVILNETTWSEESHKVNTKSKCFHKTKRLARASHYIIADFWRLCQQTMKHASVSQNV